MGPVAEKNVIASRKAAWQSASPAMHSIARPPPGAERERIATGLRPRNDMGLICGPIQPGQVVIHLDRRGYCRTPSTSPAASGSGKRENLPIEVKFSRRVVEDADPNAGSLSLIAVGLPVSLPRRFAARNDIFFATCLRPAVGLLRFIEKAKSAARAGCGL